MSKAADTTHLKQLLWTRLSADPDTLDLDDRINEQPEDSFIRMANSGSRDRVVAALRAVLTERVGMESEDQDIASEIRFLSRAIRLCDSLRAAECSNVLELILLRQAHAVWGDHLPGLQELCARVLSGLPKARGDIDFWCRLAHRYDTTLPYALNSAIDVDFRQGIKLLCDAYLVLKPQRRTQLADWRAILRMAVATHGEEALRRARQDALSGAPSELHRHFVRLAGLPWVTEESEFPVAQPSNYVQLTGRTLVIMETKLGQYDYVAAQAPPDSPNMPLRGVEGAMYQVPERNLRVWSVSGRDLKN